MIAILDDGDIQIDDVPFPQFLVVRDAMADDIVHRGADGLGEAVVVERRGDGLLHVDDVVVAEGIQFVCGDARLDVGGDHLQHVGGQLAGDTHFSISSGVLIFNGHGISLGALIAHPADAQQPGNENRCVCNQGEILSPTPFTSS